MNISGKVVRGDGYGRKLGYPTANIDAKADIAEGVYSGIALLGGKEYRAGIVVGPFGKIEAHVLNWSGDLYGKEISITPKKFLRGYKYFETEAELINQIKKDIELC